MDSPGTKLDSLPLSPLQQQCDDSNAEWLKPFDEGWQREIVLRNSIQNFGFKKSDVYYYSPDNKKLRSIPEIEAFLRNTESSLSINCFTFKKGRIHTDPSEIVRQAAPTRGRTRGGTNFIPTDGVATNSSYSTTDSGSSPAIDDEASSEAQKPSVSINVEEETQISTSRKRRRSHTPVNISTKEPEKKKAQIPDGPCAKLCSAVCFGRHWPILPLDVFCRNCGYGFHFVCIGKSCSTADYICTECAPKSDPDDCSTTSDIKDSKDVTKVATGSVPRNCEQFNASEIISSTPKKPQTLRNKSLPCVYTSRISKCQQLSKNVLSLGSLPTSPAFCSYNNEKSILIPNAVKIEPTEDEIKKKLLPEDKRRLNVRETCKTADSNASYLHLVYDSLERIFKYLAVADLLNCRLVCKTWESIASQPSLWSSKFYEFPDELQNLNSRRKNSGTDNVCEDNSVNYSRIPHLNRVNLGSCQCTMVELVIDGSGDVRLFSAELFMDKRKNIAENQWPENVILDLKVFSGMNKLEILRLRGIGKMIPIDLDQISQLRSIKTLSLTSLYQVPGSDLLSIFTLPKLKVLELGDCYQWDKEVFTKLGDLKQIEILRLEARVEEDDSGFGAALLRLKNLKRLELSRYAVGSELSKILPKVTQLQQVRIWTELLDDKMKAARLFKNLLTGVQRMTFLQSLYLGIIAPAAKDGFNRNFDIPILAENGSDSEVSDIRHMYSQLQGRLKTTKIMVQTIPLYRLEKKTAE